MTNDDCGQTPVTNILRSTFTSKAGLDIEFAQAVSPERYKLFQIADMIATLKLVELKIEHGDRLTESECKFFGGVRTFKRNYLRFVKSKEMLSSINRPTPHTNPPVAFTTSFTASFTTSPV